MLYFGCEHEHIHKAAVCDRCLAIIRAGPGMYCHVCAQGRREHLCAMAEIKLEPL